MDTGGEMVPFFAHYLARPSLGMTTPTLLSSQSSFLVARRGSPAQRSSQTLGKVFWTPADVFFPS